MNIALREVGPSGSEPWPSNKPSGDGPVMEIGEGRATGPAPEPKDSEMPRLHLPEGEMIRHAPGQPLGLALETAGVGRVYLTARRVELEDWPDFDWLARQWRIHKGEFPGSPEWCGQVRLQANGDREVRTILDVPLPTKAPGHFAVGVEALADDGAPGPRASCWVQITALDLDAVLAHDSAIAWVRDLSTGRPAGEASVSVLGLSGQAAADQDGVARLALPSKARIGSALVARQGVDSCFRLFGGDRQDLPAEFLWHVLCDRYLVQPGETLHARGWIRQDRGPGGDMEIPSPSIRSLNWKIRPAWGHQVQAGSVKVDEGGGFSLHVKVYMPQGPAFLEFQAPEFEGKASPTRCQFEVCRFLSPAAYVTIQGPSGPVVEGQSVRMEARALREDGAPCSDAEIRWSCRTDRGWFWPPRWPDFAFGTPYGRATHSEVLRARTDGSGTSQIEALPTRALAPVTRLIAKAVVDVPGHDAAVETLEICCLSSSRAVGLRQVFNGVEAVVVDLAGAPVSGVEIALQAWPAFERLPSPFLLETILSSEEPVTWHPLGLEPGYYRLDARVVDPEGKVFVTEGGFRVQDRSGAEPDQPLKPLLRADRPCYRPGDSARIHLEVPRTPAQVLLVFSRGGLLRHEVWNLDSPRVEIQVPIKEEHVPGLHLTALVHLEPEGGRPAKLEHQIYLAASAEGRRLEVTLRPKYSVYPVGPSFPVHLEVKDAQGRPAAGAELCLALLDEDLAEVAQYGGPDPWDDMYGWVPVRPLPLVTSDYPEVNQIVASDLPDQVLLLLRRWEGLSYGRGRIRIHLARPPIAPRRLRSDLCPETRFLTGIKTDGDGRAEVAVSLPDWRAHYRLVAVAIHGARDFGRGEGRVSAWGRGPRGLGIWRFPTTLPEGWRKGKVEDGQRDSSS